MIISDWDSECYMGRDSSDSESIYNTTEMHTGPENKREFVLVIRVLFLSSVCRTSQNVLHFAIGRVRVTTMIMI